MKNVARVCSTFSYFTGFSGPLMRVVNSGDTFISEVKSMQQIYSYEYDLIKNYIQILQANGPELFV